jgi:hypothetical protein
MSPSERASLNHWTKPINPVILNVTSSEPFRIFFSRCLSSETVSTYKYRNVSQVRCNTKSAHVTSFLRIWVRSLEARDEYYSTAYLVLGAALRNVSRSCTKLASLNASVGCIALLAEEFCFLRCNTVQPIDNRWAFWRNTSSPFSRLNNTANMKLA